MLIVKMKFVEMEDLTMERSAMTKILMMVMVVVLLADRKDAAMA